MLPVASATLVKQGDLLKNEFMKTGNVLKSKSDQPGRKKLEEKSDIVLHAIKTGHTVAFENAQPVITNLRSPYERFVAEQLTIKATEKKNCNRKDASTLSQA